mmetsp:Transcript_19509/g.58991  ORF Transcript_19509/g.58991 Transcript_19509/m.58991 type:complete len:213 (-) Transcript_19509:1786-2424(-)
MHPAWPWWAFPPGSSRRRCPLPRRLARRRKRSPWARRSSKPLPQSLKRPSSTMSARSARIFSSLFRSHRCPRSDRFRCLPSGGTTSRIHSPSHQILAAASQRRSKRASWTASARLLPRPSLPVFRQHSRASNGRTSSPPSCTLRWPWIPRLSPTSSVFTCPFFLSSPSSCPRAPKTGARRVHCARMTLCRSCRMRQSLIVLVLGWFPVPYLK